MDGTTDTIFLVAPYIDGEKCGAPLGFYSSEEEAAAAIKTLTSCKRTVPLEVVPVLKLSPVTRHYIATAEPTGITVESRISTANRAYLPSASFTREEKGFHAIALGTTELEAVSLVVSLVQKEDPQAQINMRITRR